MAKNIWIANAGAVAQVTTLTVGGTPAANQTYTAYIPNSSTGKSVTYTATNTDTNNTIASGLQALLGASSYPEFQEASWTVNNNVITGTSATAGTPFTVTSAASGTGTLVTATTTAATGPNDAANAANWSTGTLPTVGDDVYLTGTSQGILYGLTAAAYALFNSVTEDSTFTGQVGLPPFNPSGYREYRPTFWQVSPVTWTTLAGSGAGSQLTQVDFGTNPTTLIVNATGTPLIQGRPALVVKGTNVSNVLVGLQGSVGIAIDPGDVSTFATLQIGYQSNPAGDFTLTCGPGCTLTTLTQDGGTVNLNASLTTATIRNQGTLNVFAAATITTWDCEDGEVVWYSSGSLGTGTVGINGWLDLSHDPRNKTATALTVYGKFTDKNQVFPTGVAVYYPIGIGQNGATVDLGTNLHLTRT